MEEDQESSISLSSPTKKGSSYRYSDEDCYPCSHFRSLNWDRHQACVYCLLKSESVCTVEDPCEICSQWSQDKWQRYSLKVVNKRAEMAKKAAKRSNQADVSFF